MNKIFASIVILNASGTLAARVFDHLERLGPDGDGCITVMRKVMGRFYGKYARIHARRDREYWGFDMPDGSVVMVNPRPLENWKQDELGDTWPWLMAFPNRSACDAIMSRVVAPASDDVWASTVREIFIDEAIAA